MTKLIIKNVGPIKEVDIELNRLNVFIGPQSSGKSTIAKIISFCTWVEKDVATSQSLSEYQNNDRYFIERLESFHKMKGYFKPSSYIFYKSDVVEITWKDEKCDISWVDRYAYKRSKIAYIPSERNMTILPEARKSEFGNTNIRSFLFDWFEARKKYTHENKLPILNFDIDYYYLDGNDEDHIKDRNNEYDILLSNASSGLQSITPLVIMVEYLTRWIYSEDSISFDQDERQQKVSRFLAAELAIKPFFNKQKLEDIEYIKFVKEFNTKLHEKDNDARIYFNKYKVVTKQLFQTDNSQYIIEEPEQNLFPEAQRDLIYYLIQRCFDKEGNRLTFTTHSPYVLYALNNCMMAKIVNRKISDNNLSKLKCNTSQIDPSIVSIYEIRNGYVSKTIQGEDGLISDNYFDQKMKELMDDFYLMLNYYS